MAKFFIPLLIVGFILILISPLATLAMENNNGIIKVEQGETINYNIVKFANSIQINGRVEGDVIVAGADVDIDGPVSGDIIAAANLIRINSEVGGNVRVVANQIEINGKIGKNVNLFASSIIIGDKAEILGDLTCWGENITIAGKIAGDVDGGGKKLNLASEISGNVNLKIESAGSFKIADNTVINGDLTYQATKQIQIPETSQIKGKTSYLILAGPENKFFSPSYWFKNIISFFGLLLIAMIVFYLRPNIFERINQTIIAKPWFNLLRGIAYLLVIPLIVVGLLISIIGIPLAVIILFLYLLIIYLSKIAAAVWLGQKLFPRIKPTIWVLVLGLLIIIIITTLPQIGGLISLIIICFVFGALSQILKEVFKS